MTVLGQRSVALAVVAVFASLVLVQYARTGATSPPVCAAVLGLLWLGQLLSLTFLMPFLRGDLSFNLNDEVRTPSAAIAEAAFAVSLVYLHSVMAVAVRARVLGWLVGLTGVQVLVYDSAEAKIKRELRASTRAYVNTAPSIQSRWHAEHETWWTLQLLTLRALSLLVDLIKMVLLAVYLLTLRKQLSE